MANLDQVEEDPKHVKMSTEVSALCQPNANGLSTVESRHPVPLPSLIPTFADACNLVSSPYSCLVTESHRRHIALSPMYLNKKRTGIQDELNTELLKYSENLNGVPLAYDNIRILGQQGTIFDDSGYIHLDIEASFVVFQPLKGQKLLGIVNKLGVSHAGCLVHGCFNASVPKPSLVSVETWREAGPRIGAELEFEVFQLDADTAGVLLIRGRLDRTRVQELMAVGDSSGHEFPPTDELEEPVEEPAPEPAAEPAVEPAVEPFPDPALESTPEPAEDSMDGTHNPKKKKKKKGKQREEEEEAATLSPSSLPGGALTQEQNGAAEDSSINSHTREKKKKKKRDKHREEETPVSYPGLQEVVVKREPNRTIEEAYLGFDVTERKKKKKEKKERVKCVKEEPVSTPIEVPWGDSSGCLSDKPNKKRKNVPFDDITSCFDDVPEKPKAKKKKKDAVRTSQRD